MVLVHFSVSFQLLFHVHRLDCDMGSIGLICVHFLCVFVNLATYKNGTNRHEIGCGLSSRQNLTLVDRIFGPLAIVYLDGGCH